MLKIVSKSTNEILFSCDAWVSDCLDRAFAFIGSHGLQYIDSEITFSGDMIYWVA